MWPSAAVYSWLVRSSGSLLTRLACGRCIPLGMYWVLAKLAMTVVVFGWNYTFNASVTFRKPSEQVQAVLDPVKLDER